jgi:hypothetical protein
VRHAAAAVAAMEDLLARTRAEDDR